MQVFWSNISSKQKLTTSYICNSCLCLAWRKQSFRHWYSGSKVLVKIKMLIIACWEIQLFPAVVKATCSYRSSCSILSLSSLNWRQIPLQGYHSEQSPMSHRKFTEYITTMLVSNIKLKKKKDIIRVIIPKLEHHLFNHQIQRLKPTCYFGKKQYFE